TSGTCHARNQSRPGLRAHLLVQSLRILGDLQVDGGLQLGSARRRDQTKQSTRRPCNTWCRINRPVRRNPALTQTALSSTESAGAIANTELTSLALSCSQILSKDAAI